MLRKWIIVLVANSHYFVNTQDDEEDSDSDDDDLSDADLVETALESYTTPIDNEEDLENAVDEYVSFKEVMSGKYTEKRRLKLYEKYSNCSSYQQLYPHKTKPGMHFSLAA